MLRRAGLHRFALLGTALLAVNGCSNTGPTAPAVSVQILAAKYTLACGNWSPTEPPVTRTVIDLQFSGRETALAAGLEAIRANGGVVTHTFQVGGYVRAEIDVDRLLPLHTPPEFFLWHAVTVSDPASFKVTLIVVLDHPITDQDVATAVSLGGTVTRRFTIISGYVVEIDDRLVPLLKTVPGFRYVEANSVGCLV